MTIDTSTVYDDGFNTGYDEGYEYGYQARTDDNQPEINEYRTEIVDLEGKIDDLEGEMHELKNIEKKYDELEYLHSDLKSDYHEAEEDRDSFADSLDVANEEVAELGPLAEKYTEITQHLKDQYPEVYADLIMCNMLVN